MSEIKFEIKKSLGVISEGSKDWKKELNITSWNGGADKLDIRSWDKDHEHMSRGITLTEEEMDAIVKLYSEYKENREV